MEINISTELRLIICGWCFSVALWVAPKNVEGLIVVDSVHSWASRSAAYLSGTQDAVFRSNGNTR